MVITYHGGECIKIVSGPATIAFNPPSKDSKLKSPRFGADMVLVSLNHPDMNGVEQMNHGEKQPFVIQGPGEYEVSGTIVRGIPSTSSYGGRARINTIYLMRLEGVQLCFLGALGTRRLSSDILEAIDGVDVLFVPIGGKGVLTAPEAHELAVELGPAIEIPMHYTSAQSGEIGEKDALRQFLKEEGAEKEKAVDKLVLKKKDLEGKEGEVVVLGN